VLICSGCGCGCACVSVIVSAGLDLCLRQEEGYTCVQV